MRPHTRFQEKIGVLSRLLHAHTGHLLRDFYWTLNKETRSVPVVLALMAMGLVFMLLQPAYIGYVTYGTGQTYYVDSVDGNDINNGLSPANAIKSISRINNLNIGPGDSILFKRGGTWRFPAGSYLNVRSGNEAAYTYYGAYGTGAKPVFLGSMSKNNLGDWSDMGSNVWRSSDVSNYNRDVGNIIVNNDASSGAKYMDQGSLNSQGEFTYDSSSDRVYMYSTSNPASVYGSIELALHKTPVSTDYDHHVIIANISVKYSGLHGITGGAGGPTHHIIVQDCDVNWIGGSYQPGQAPLRYGNGIEFAVEADDVTVSGNNVSECWDACLTSQSWAGAGEQHFVNHFYNHNIVRNCAYGFEYFNNYATGSTNNMIIEHNTIIDSGYGWSSTQDGNRGRGFVLNRNPVNSQDIIVRNNVIYNSRFKSIDLGGGSAYNWKGPDPELDYNIYKKGVGSYFFGWHGVDYWTFDSFRSATGQEDNGIEADPQLSSSYRPLAGSPACNMSTQGSYVGAFACIGHCSDNICNGEESCSSCPIDCGQCAATCGDNTCDAAENCLTCPDDCGQCPPVCGDGTCEGTETCSICPSDCGVCAPVCGDNTCDASENCSTCESDCGICSPTCGDDTCDAGETCTSCESDCGVCPPICGDNVCDTSENCETCSSDCGACPPSGLPLDMTGQVPEQATVIIYTDKPIDAIDSIVTLTTFDPDYGDEGTLSINGNSIQLFGDEARSDYDSEIVDITYDVPEEWWNNGSNTLSFTHTQTAGFSINSIGVTFFTGCGDGTCDISENCQTCSSDCGACPAVCGDGTCDASENCSSCQTDCGTCAFCGDGSCNTGESCSDCASDCGACIICGDGTCNGDEACSSCQNDCGACESGGGSSGGGSSGGGTSSTTISRPSIVQPPEPDVEEEPIIESPEPIPSMEINGETSFSVSDQLAIKMNNSYFLIKILNISNDSVKALVSNKVVEIHTGESQRILVGREKVTLSLKGITDDNANFVISANEPHIHKKITAETIAPLPEQQSTSMLPYYLIGILVGTTLLLYMWKRRLSAKPDNSQGSDNYSYK